MRQMAFAETSLHVVARLKTVTRRRGWRFLRPGDRVHAVDRIRNRTRAQRRTLAVLRVESVRVERLDAITAEDVAREGFPGLDPAAFVALYTEAFGAGPEVEVTRIEFSYVD